MSSVDLPASVRRCTGLLSELERVWRPAIRTVSLLGELELDEADVRRALGCLGRLWRLIDGTKTASELVLRRYPSVYAAALAGFAGHSWDGGLWPHIGAAMELRVDTNLAVVLGRLFERCLDRLGLTSFPQLDDEPHLRYVSRILLHAGVPLHSLGDWLELLTAAEERLGTEDPSALHAHLLDRADRGRIYQKDTSVVRFIRFGGTYAIDLLDRTQDLVRILRDGGHDIDSVRLPAPVVGRLRELVARQPAITGVRRRAPALERAPRPSVRFDPYGVGVHLLLPQVRAPDGCITWHVRLDGERETALARAERPGGLTSSVETPLEPRTQRVEVEADGSTSSLRLAEPHDPVLLFDVAGDRTGMTGLITTDHVWAVYPADSDLVAEPAARVVEHLDIVPRWSGWVARRLDLDGVQWLGLNGGRRRPVSRELWASLEGEPLMHITDADGRPVYASWPVLRLPGEPGVPLAWTVVLTDLATGTKRTEDVPVEDAAVDLPLADLAEGWRRIAVVDLVVRGPLGRGLRSAFTVVEDLRVRITPAFRRFGDGEAVPADVRLVLPGEATQWRHLEAGQASAHVIVGRDRPLQLVVTPPAMGVRWIRGSTPAPWSLGRLKLVSEELQAGRGALLVRVPGDQPVSLTVTDPGGTPLQRIEPSNSRGHDIAAFDLARITETVARHRTCSLLVTGARADRVADIRPRRLVEEVHADANRGVLELRGVAGVSGLRVACYRHLAPTEPPAVLDVPDGAEHAVLPDHLLHTGPLRIRLGVDDPWLPIDWPPFPRPGENVFDVLDLPVDRPALEALSPLAPLLAGEVVPASAQLPLATALELSWLVERVEIPQHNTIRERVRKLLQRDPQATLSACLATSLRPATLASVLCGSGFTELDIKGDLSDDDVDRLWSRWAPLGLLAGAPVLRRGSDGPRAQALRQLACEHAGPSLGTLLAGRNHEFLQLPVFDHPRWIDFADEQLDALFHHAGIVASPLLDRDAQALAARSLLSALRSGRATGVHDVADDADPVVERVLGLLDGVGLTDLGDAVRTRARGPGWQMLPAMSLALAAIARLDARLSPLHRCMRSSWRRHLSVLAYCAPKLVGADLVMAEAVILGRGK